MSCRAGQAHDPCAPGVIDATRLGTCHSASSSAGPTLFQLPTLTAMLQPLNPLLENLPPVMKQEVLQRTQRQGGLANWSVRRWMESATAGGEQLSRDFGGLCRRGGSTASRGPAAEQTGVARRYTPPPHRRTVCSCAGGQSELDAVSVAQAGGESSCRRLAASSAFPPMPPPDGGMQVVELLAGDARFNHSHWSWLRVEAAFRAPSRRWCHPLGMASPPASD